MLSLNQDSGHSIGLIQRRSLVIAISISLIATTMLMWRAGLTIALNPASLAFGIVGVALLALCFGFRASTQPWKRFVAIGAEDVLIFTSISLMGAVASYAVAAGTQGWVDEAMAAFDHAIGFDWLDWYEQVAASRFLQISGMAVYASIFITPAILICTFTASGQRAEAREFLLSFWLAAAISLFLFHFLPTLGPLAYLWYGPIHYMPTSGLYQAELIPLLRDHRIGSVDLGALRGLVGPPSFHAASAILYIIAAWRLRRFRIAVTVLNFAMLLSIPVEGTHYAIDVISGSLVAIAAYLIVHRFVRAAGPASAGYGSIGYAESPSTARVAVANLAA
jgi:hypothetical protein